jgi:hypothetical protein
MATRFPRVRVSRTSAAPRSRTQYASLGAALRFIHLSRLPVRKRHG